MKSTPAASSILLRPDLCVIGAGRAGLAVANGAAALSVPTLIVDRSDLGSALPRAGEIARMVLRHAAGRQAASTAGSSLDWDGMRAAALAAAETLRTGMSATHLRALGVTVIQGAARFADRDTLHIDGVVVKPRRIILATGVTPAVPALSGLDTVPWLCADRWIEWPTLPNRLIVLGAGRTGIELAQIFGRLGSRVTLVDGAAPLRSFDPELAAPVLTQLRQQGIVILGNRAVVRAEPFGAGLKLVTRRPDGIEEIVQGDVLLLATGWQPAVDGLGLDLAGIRRDPQGIAVAPDGRTDNARVFAIGDVAGRGRSTSSAEAQAGIALRAALFRQRIAFDPRAVPRILRTDPEIAVVGLTEVEARGRHGNVRVWRWPYAQNDRARAEGSTSGHIKVLTTSSGRIVGAGIVGPEASEAIGLWALAVAQGLRLGDIAALPLPVGAYADLSRRVALQEIVAGLKNPWLRRTMKVVRWLG